VHADRVRAEPQRLLDAADQVLRVGVGGVHGAGGQVDDQRHVREAGVRDVPQAALVQHDGVDAVDGQLPDERVHGLAPDHRPVTDRVIERNDDEPAAAEPEQAAEPQFSCEVPSSHARSASPHLTVLVAVRDGRRRLVTCLWLVCVTFP
jgi:hypothetical protein